MNMLEVHAAALEHGNSIFHEFLLRYRKDGQIVYGIVEGADDPVFYQGIIEQFLPTGWDVQLIKSGGRVNVLNSIPYFNWELYSRQRVCFFIDRDLTLYHAIADPEMENLYITDKYSIENEAGTFGTVQRVLHDVLNVANLSPPEAEKIKRKFEENLEKYQDAMSPLMAQIILWQRKGLKPNLGNIHPKDWFKFDCGDLLFQLGFDSSLARIRHAAEKVGCPISTEAEVAKVEEEFRAKEGKSKFVRGKYIMWFVIESCLEFHRRIDCFSANYTAPPKVKIAMGHANAMVLVAPRIRCPDSLKLFLQNAYCKYITAISEESKLRLAPEKSIWDLVKNWVRKLLPRHQ